MNRSLLEDRHVRVLRVLGCALELGDDPYAWAGLPVVLTARLSHRELDRLLQAVLLAVDADQVSQLLMDRLVLAGSPLPVLVSIDDDARWWADLASPAELRAWLAACFVRLPHRDRMAFLETATRRAAA